MATLGLKEMGKVGKMEEKGMGIKVFPGSRKLAPDSCVVIVSRLTLLLHYVA